MLCKVDVLLPDTPKAKSHLETYAYVVKEENYGYLVCYLENSYVFYSIETCGQSISHSLKYVHKKFVKL